MSRRKTRIAGVMIAVLTATGASVCTPVYAGTTQSDLVTEDVTRINTAYTGKTLGCNDLAFATLSTVAEYDDTTGLYNVTETYPLKYRMYFNPEKETGGTHAPSLTGSNYRIVPSGGGTDNPEKWPFPELNDALNNATTDREAANNIREIVEAHVVSKYFWEESIYCSNGGNTPNNLTDARQGIFTWRQSLDMLSMQGSPKQRPYLYHETDSNGSYLTADLQIYDISGKPGDKLEVTIWHFYVPNRPGTATVLNDTPYTATADGDLANLNDGIVVVSGYIYMPYTVTYNLNGGTGQTPTVAAGEIFTCDHNKVKVPVQDDTFQNGDADLLGWSPAPVDGLVTDTSSIEGFTPVGEEYTITGDENVVLYAVWGKNVPAVTYNITYDYNGGSEPVDANPVTYTDKDSVNIVNEPVRQGFEFIGWTGDNGDTPQKQVSFGPGENGDKTYKANWQAKTDIKLNKNLLVLNKGKSDKLIATVTPKEAENKTVTWSSSDKNVVTVDSSGNVKAVNHGKATITAKTADGKTATCEVRVNFIDVTNPKDWYFSAVYWAVQKDIATGTDGMFLPASNCTREQAITFIWRMAGRPNPKSMTSKFFDVKDSKRYSYKAIMWGSEKGLITGANGKFCPTDTCTREQIVTMLWRQAGKPAPKSMTSVFKDVKDSNRYSYKAIMWAHGKGITTGGDGLFSPTGLCKRRDIVTFIYRYNK